MSKAKIEHPKVFISYAWTSKEYEEKVAAFAYSLSSNGIEVLFDRFNLSEGNSVQYFMEKSVADKTVTNILILINPVYSEKANSRSGGVGAETQIISPEVYSNVEQTKVLPIVFERDANGNIIKPIYLKQTLHFDLSIPETYNEEYQRLVKKLFGVMIYPKPQLGKMPSWVEEDIHTSSVLQLIQISEIKKITSESDRLLKFNDECKRLKKSLIEFVFDGNDYVSMYNELQAIKKEYTSLMSIIPYVPNSAKKIVNSFESIITEYRQNYNPFATVKQLLIHELFIYLIAICYKNELSTVIGYLLKHSYDSVYGSEALDSFRIFCQHEERFDNAICNKDNQKYYCGMAEYWMQTLDINTCNKNEFVFADVLCFNVTLFRKDHKWWYPYTYIYSNDEYSSIFSRFARGLKSKERLENASIIFGFDNVDDFIKTFKEISLDSNITSRLANIRYPSSYNNPQNLFQFIKPSELATTN